MILGLLINFFFKKKKKKKKRVLYNLWKNFSEFVNRVGPRPRQVRPRSKAPPQINIYPLQKRPHYKMSKIL